MVSVLTCCLVFSHFGTRCVADVKSSGPDHFSLRVEKEIQSPPNVAWHHLLKIGSWWNSSHTWSGDAKNLTLDTKPGGGFDETLPSGGFVRHMTVIYCDPEKKLRMSGVLGPLQEEGLTGTMTITLTRKETGTIISAVYKVSGHLDGGLDKIAPLVDQVLTEQVTRLTAIINHGPPAKP
ncbi:MAG: SRPBCC domain-containing protein [Planctomycetota bacterium]